MNKITIYIILSVCLLASCKSVQVAVPASLKDYSEKYHVKGTGVSVFGHKIKIDGFGEARMYSGFGVKTSSGKRWFPWYYDFDKRLNYISTHFPNIISRSKIKYHFDFTSNDIYINTYCAARSSESTVDVKPLNLQLSLGENYSFDGLIFTNKDTIPWQLSFNASKSYKNGIVDYAKNVHETSGTLSNNIDTIDVNVVHIKTSKDEESIRRIPFKIAAGYEFRLNGNLLAFVDILDRNIWVSKSLDAYTRAVLVSAATSILVKTNA
jgi:hypothetical protein